MSTRLLARRGSREAAKALRGSRAITKGTGHGD